VNHLVDTATDAGTDAPGLKAAAATGQPFPDNEAMLPGDDWDESPADARCFFAAGSAALRCVAQVVSAAELVRIATAYFEASGYQVLQDMLAGKQIRLMVGRSEGGRDHATEVLREFEHELATGNMERRTRAMRLMLEALQQGSMVVGVGCQAVEQAAAMDARYLYHHAKLYFADRHAAVVSSANFSLHGLTTSREAGFVVTDPDAVAFFVHHFDIYFANAESITRPLIERLLAWLKAYDPFQIYARALLELYGLPDEDAPASLPRLAPYQRAVVSSVLAALLMHRGAFLIASTGLGKTIIAAHVVAYLRMQEEIDSVLVVCPAGIKEMWRRMMRAAKTTCAEFSYHTLSGQDRRLDAGVGALEHELRNVDDKTLIILDESHHLRNQDGEDGEMRLSNERILEAVDDRHARVLLMTATPYSKSREDVNSQLRLLPAPNTHVTTQIGVHVPATEWRVDELGQLSDLPSCTVLTTPDVVKHYGQQDDLGERFVEFAPGDKRYFPRRIVLRTVRYDNPLDDLLVDLLTGDLLYRQVASESDSRQMALFGAEVIEASTSRRGRRDPLFEASVLHQFCSSAARVQLLFQDLETGRNHSAFQNQAQLRKFVRAKRGRVSLAARPKNDAKLSRLVEIIEQAHGAKVTVFCHYLETAKRLKDGLAKRLRHLRVETTAEAKCRDIDQILQRFAPVANEVPPEDRRPQEELQVLVATGALAEGYNLQDARILVNYDLPWTVLQLAQRMGRLLRPWREPREIHVYNFVPSTMENPQVRHARQWQRRLEERNEEHRAFAQIPVLIRRELGGRTEEGYQMEILARELYLRDDDGLDLDQVLDFVHSADSLATSTFYRDLVNIQNPAELSRLPAGIRSARMSKGAKRLFVLFRQGARQMDAALFDARGRLVNGGDRRDVVMQAIRCSVDEPKASVNLYPEDDVFDEWIEHARQHWAELQNVPAHRLQIVCAMALIPERAHPGN